MQRGSIISYKIIAQLLFLVIIIIVIIIKSLYIYRLVEYLKSFSFLFFSASLFREEHFSHAADVIGGQP